MGRRGWEGGEGARRGARPRADTPLPPPSHSCNLGYAFVNCTGPAAAAACAAALHGARWSAFNSRKVCAVAWARVQGRAALVDHFRGARFPAAGAGCVPLAVELGPPAGGEPRDAARPVLSIGPVYALTPVASGSPIAAATAAADAAARAAAARAAG